MLVTVLVTWTTGSTWKITGNGENLFRLVRMSGHGVQVLPLELVLVLRHQQSHVQTGSRVVPTGLGTYM